MGFIKNTGAGKPAEWNRRAGANYWSEDDARTRYEALTDAYRVYAYRDLEENLRRFGWRRARRETLKRGALSRQWVSRGHGDLRLTRGGLEMRFESRVRVMAWKKLKEMVEERRSRAGPLYL